MITLKRLEENADDFYGHPQKIYPPTSMPTSVCESLAQIKKEDWASMVQVVFGSHSNPDKVTIADVLRVVKQTDRASSADFPTEVFIDPDGDCTLMVYSDEAQKEAT